MNGHSGYGGAEPQLQQTGPPPGYYHAAPIRQGPPLWVKLVMIFMGLCTPGGFLFLLALITESNIRFDLPVWFILAALGGVGGWLVSRKT